MSESNGINNTIYDAVSNALENKINNCNTLLPSTTGKSTYDLAVDYGYIGTERDWLSNIANDTTVVSNLYADANSLSEFVFKPAGFKVTRRLAPTIDTLQFYVNSLSLAVTEAQGKVEYIETTVQDAINNTAVEGGVLADTFVTVTANGTGSVARTQRDKNNDTPSIKDFANVDDAQAAAISQGIKIFIPTGEHTYDLTNVDMTLFWGYGQLKDTTTGDIYKPKNGDFITPDMFGIKERVDETTKLNAMFNYAAKNSIQVRFNKSAEYWFTNIRVVGRGLNVDWVCMGGCTVQLVCIADHATATATPVYMSGQIDSTMKITSSFSKGADILRVENPEDIEVGALVVVKYENLVGSENRGHSREGFTTTVRKKLVSSGMPVLETPFPFSSYGNDDIVTTVSEIVSSTELRLEGLDHPSEDYRPLVTFGSTDSSENLTLHMINWDNTTKIASFFKTRADGVIPNIEVGATVTISSAAQVDVYNSPNSYSMVGDIRISGQPYYNAVSGYFPSGGVSLGHAKMIHLEDISITQFARYGLSVNYSTHCTLERLDISEANFSWRKYDGQGYGIEFSTVSNSTISDCTIARCRKGIDIKGAFYSYNILVKDCTVFGSGLSYTGIPFYPATINGEDGDTSYNSGGNNNSGFGSHATALNVQYVNCTAHNVKMAFSLHGTDETIINGRHLGRGKHCVRLGSSVNSKVLGFIYDDLHSLVVPKNTSKPCLERAFLTIDDANPFRTRGLPHVVRDCIVKSVSPQFIYLESIVESPDIVLANNTCYINKGISTASDFYVIGTDQKSYKINNVRDGGGNQFIDVNDTYDMVSYVKDGYRKLTRTATGTTRSISVSLLKDTSVFIPTLSTAIRISVSPITPSRRFGIKDLYFQSDSRNTLPFEDVFPTARRNITVLNKVLTGTTGIDSEMTISFTPPTGRQGVYLENRLAGQEDIFIEITEFL